ncbi:MAG: extracellular solute-binding protein [Micrococcales bacterium]|nr:extracellular solute-binding protein [Micrococcales bacterium]
MHIKYSKRIIALTLVAASAVTLGACGGTSNNSTGTGNTTGGATAESTPATSTGGGTAEATSGSMAPDLANNCSSPVTVTFWQQQFEDYQQAWYKKFVDQFNAAQNCVKVNYQVVTADTWTQKLQAAQAAGTQPDIATTSYGNIKPGVAQGQFAPLDQYLPASAFADIKSNVQSFVTMNNQHWAYPMLVEPSTVLYINNTAAQAAGLDPANPPKSWADLLTWSQKLTTGNVKGITIASVAADLGWSSWGMQYNSCGYFPISDDWSAARATDPCFADVANFYKSLYPYMPQNPKVGYTDASPYENGEVAMMVNGSWAWGQLKLDKPALVQDTTVVAMPTKDGGSGETTATLGGWTLTLDAKSKNPKQAAEFINYLAAGDPNIMAEFFNDSGFSKYTVRTSVDQAIATNYPDTTQDAAMQTISKDIVAYGIAEPIYPWDIALAMGTAIEATMKGTSTVDAALKTANDSINKTIQQQGLAGTNPNNS